MPLFKIKGEKNSFLKKRKKKNFDPREKKKNYFSGTKNGLGDTNYYKNESNLLKLMFVT